MKRILATALLLCGIYAASSAQGVTILEQFYSKMAENAAVMDYDYSLTMSGVKTTGEGILTTQDQSYVMQGSGIRIYCDAKMMWVVDEAGKEILIDSVAEGQEAYMANPVLLFTDLFKVFQVGSPEISGNIISYVLTPKSDCGIVSGVISLNTAGKSPVFSSGVFKTADGSQLDVKIKSMTFVQKKPLTFYTLDLSGFDSSWMITDIR